MPTSAGRQVIELKPGLGSDPRTRPLKTGKGFVLTVGLPRVIQLCWDRASYDPGDSCKLTLSGSGLGTKALEVTVEAEGGAGAWEPVATVKAAVEGDQASAVAEWKFPVPPGYAELVAARAEAARGKLLNARWGSTEHAVGEPLEVHVEAEGMEKASLLCLVEREEAGGRPAVEQVAAPAAFISIFKSSEIKTAHLKLKDAGQIFAYSGVCEVCGRPAVTNMPGLRCAVHRH